MLHLQSDCVFAWSVGLALLLLGASSSVVSFHGVWTIQSLPVQNTTEVNWPQKRKMLYLWAIAAFPLPIGKLPKDHTDPYCWTPLNTDSSWSYGLWKSTFLGERMKSIPTLFLESGKYSIVLDSSIAKYWSICGFSVGMPRTKLTENNKIISNLTRPCLIEQEI